LGSPAEKGNLDMGGWYYSPQLLCIIIFFKINQQPYISVGLNANKFSRRNTNMAINQRNHHNENLGWMLLINLSLGVHIESGVLFIQKEVTITSAKFRKRNLCICGLDYHCPGNRYQAITMIL